MDRNSRPVMVVSLGKDEQGYCFKTASQRIGIPGELVSTLQPILYEATGHRSVAQLVSSGIAESALVSLFNRFEELGVCYEAHHVALYGHRAASYPDPLRLVPPDGVIRDLMKLPDDPEGEFISINQPAAGVGQEVRRTCRSFKSHPLALGAVSSIAYAAYGITETTPYFSRRTVPSAGAMYPLQIDYFMRSVEGAEPGLYRWGKHRNGFIYRRPINDDVLKDSFLEEVWRIAPVIQVVSFDIARSAGKYASRAHRFALLEAGHAAQNAILKATTLGLGSWEYGGYCDNALMKLIELNGPTCGIATVLFCGHVG